MMSIYFTVAGFFVKALSIVAPPLAKKICPVSLRTYYLDDPPYTIAFDDAIKPAVNRYKRLRDIAKGDLIVWVEKAQLRICATNNTEKEVLIKGIRIVKKPLKAELRSSLSFVPQGYKQITFFEIDLDDVEAKPRKIEFVDHERKPTEDVFRYEVLTIESKEQEVIDLTLFSSNDSLEVDVILDFLIDGKLKSRELKKKVFITPLREIPANERYWRIHLDGREFNKFKPDEDLNLRDQ